MAADDWMAILYLLQRPDVDVRAITVTGAGARLLAAHLAAPLTDPVAIDKRLDAVGFFAEQDGLRADLRLPR